MAFICWLECFFCLVRLVVAEEEEEEDECPFDYEEDDDGIMAIEEVIFKLVHNQRETFLLKP